MYNRVEGKSGAEEEENNYLNMNTIWSTARCRYSRHASINKKIFMLLLISSTATTDTIRSLIHVFPLLHIQLFSNFESVGVDWNEHIERKISNLASVWWWIIQTLNAFGLICCFWFRGKAEDAHCRSKSMRMKIDEALKCNKIFVIKFKVNIDYLFYIQPWRQLKPENGKKENWDRKSILLQQSNCS